MSTELDPSAVRSLRFAVGTCIAVAIASGVGWSFSFITPVLVAKLLATSSPRLTFRAGASIFLSIAAAFAFGFVLSLLVLPYPPIRLLVVGLVMFLIFYASEGGAPALLVVMLLIAVTALPILATQSPALAGSLTVSFPASAVIAIALAWLAHAIFPDHAGSPQPDPAAASTTPSLPPPDARARSALTSTIVVLPIFIAFDTLQLASEMVILIYVAILAQQLTGDAVARGGQALIIGNLVGGICTIVFYQLLIAVPSYVFLLLLNLAVGLLFGRRIFSGTASAPLYATGFTTLLILIGSSTAPFGGEADSKFYTRLAQITIAITYMIGASLIVERLGRQREAARV